MQTIMDGQRRRALLGVLAFDRLESRAQHFRRRHLAPIRELMVRSALIGLAGW